MSAGSRAMPESAADTSARLHAAIESVRTAVRRENGRETPLGVKAIRTRARLLAAAEVLLAEKGYAGTTPSEIAARAGTGIATFYQYFPHLRGIIAVLAGDHAIESLSRGVDRWNPASGRIGLRRAVAALVSTYWDNVEFFRMWEPVSQTDERLAEMRRAFWAVYKHHIESTLRDAVALGVVRADVEPAQMARALTLMAGNYCYDILIYDPPSEPPSYDDIVDTLTTLWADAIDLLEPSSARVARIAKPPARSAVRGPESSANRVRLLSR